MTHKSYLMMLVAAALLTLLPTACTDDLNETGETVGTSGEGHAVAVKGVTFYEAEAFAEDTIAGHQPTMETNVDDGPDMDVMGRVTYNAQTEAKARRAAAENGGIQRCSMQDLMNEPTLAKQLKEHHKARRSSAKEEKIVAGRKPAVPMRHKAAANDSVQTRSLDVDDESAIFVVGDSVGVYEVDQNGTMVQSNKKMVLNISGTWDSETPLEYTSGHRYFAYHPYRTNAQLSELGASVGDTESYATFFSDLKDKWSVTNDQGTYEKYHACDLLGGEAVWNSTTKTLGFPMHHLMGMLQLEFGVARIYLDWADERSDHYPYWWTDTVTTSLKDGMILLPQSGGKYRRITRPGSALTVSAVDDAWVMRFTAEGSISSGHYQHYDIGRTTSNNQDFYQIFYNQLGDILLRDGRLVHRHDFNRISPNSPVGIVVGTVYPAINPFINLKEGPIEDITYNKHSLEREYLYDMAEISRTGTEPELVTVVMRPRFIRCLIMSLKDVTFQTNTAQALGNAPKPKFPSGGGSAWDYSEAFSHMPNTHCVGTPSNRIWSGKEMKWRVNNSWYPTMTASWNAKEACNTFNGLDPNQGGYGISEGDKVHKWTPTSGWFIGTAGQYQMAFCFGRERCWGDPWDKYDGTVADPDGYYAPWCGEFYQGQYETWRHIDGVMQNAETFIDQSVVSYSNGTNNYTRTCYWYPNVGDECPTLRHDFARINNAMGYATGYDGGNYDNLNGEYVTSTPFCSMSLYERFFPNIYSWWDYTKKYWNYKDWDKSVTVKIDLSHDGQRGYCYCLGSHDTTQGGKIRPLMAL